MFNLKVVVHSVIGNVSSHGSSRRTPKATRMSSRPEEFHLRALPEPCMTLSSHTAPDVRPGAVAGLVGIECGVVSGVVNLESSGVEASDWRPRHDEHYHEA